jgi:hypothetical protein
LQNYAIDGTISSGLVRGGERGSRSFFLKMDEITLIRAQERLKDSVSSVTIKGIL